MDVRLKARRSIGKSKRHNQIFIQPVPGIKGCLPLIALANANTIVGVFDVNLYKDLSATDTVYDFINQW